MTDTDLCFVYRCDSCGRYRAVRRARQWAYGRGGPPRCGACSSGDQTHTATADPATTLVALLNADAAERARMIADLQGTGRPAGELVTCDEDDD